MLQAKAQDTFYEGKRTEEGQFYGLGDCFCITDPNREDNPIIGASDGFVRVTGYSRSDIINHNCRFLQGNSYSPFPSPFPSVPPLLLSLFYLLIYLFFSSFAFSLLFLSPITPNTSNSLLLGLHTDRATSRRIGRQVREERESTELLLNYRKNGTPFWNLLYICPLKDPSGKTQFFLGGQIDVTKNVNNASPIKAMLQDLEGGVPQQQQQKKKWRLLGTFRRLTTGQPHLGAESNLVKGSYDYETQRDIFLETYTTFLVFDGKRNKDKVLFASNRFFEVTGFLQSDILGKDTSFMQGPLTSSKALGSLALALRTSQEFTTKLVAYDADGSPNFCQIFLTPVLDLNQNPVFNVAVMKWRTPTQEELEEAEREGKVNPKSSASSCPIQ